MVNDITAQTEAKFNKATVTLHQTDNGVVKDGDNATLTVKAEDASFIGAWSGATAITWQQSNKTKTRGDLFQKQQNFSKKFFDGLFFALKKSVIKVKTEPFIPFRKVF